MELFLIAVVAVSLVGFWQPALIHKLSFNPYRIRKHHEYWRWFTYPLVHNGGLHLATNTLGIWYVLSEVTAGYTNYVAVVLVFGGCLASVVPTYLMRRDDIDYKLVGASGIMAVLFAAYTLVAGEADPLVVGLMVVWILKEGVLVLREIAGKLNKQDYTTAHDVHLLGWLYGVGVSAAVLFWYV
ncbi:MAG: rhomboid family intramembrane serine protease [Flavobacteriales bacterium]